jgi:hypothetical protein
LEGGGDVFAAFLLISMPERPAQCLAAIMMALDLIAQDRNERREHQDDEAERLADAPSSRSVTLRSAQGWIIILTADRKKMPLASGKHLKQIAY